MRRPVTSTDVARRAGVSQATVSLALSATSGTRVSEATRERVREVAQELGYSPSRPARALRTGRSQSIIVITPDVPGAIGYLAIGDLVDKIGAAGLELVIHRRDVGEALSAVWEGAVPTAIIGSEIPTEGELEDMRAAGVIPLFLDMASVSRRMGELQVRHLVESGCRRVAYVGPGDIRHHAFLEARIDGAATTCRELGIDDLVVEDIELDRDSAERTVHLLREQSVTGVAAYNDDHGFAVLSGARTLELRVPEDLAVIGADDVPLGKVADPPLSTVKVGASGLVNGLSELLVRSPFEDIEADVVVVQRSSTRPASPPTRR